MSSPCSKTELDELAPPVLYHMTHFANLASILGHGLLAHNNSFKKMDISNQTVNQRRQRPDLVYHRSIHDYVPLYFNPRNAMLYKTPLEHHDRIIMLGFDSHIMLDQGSLITNGNAAAANTTFFDDLNALKNFNWNLIFSQSWNDYGNHVKQAMMSEVLIYQVVELEHLQSISCASYSMTRHIQQYFASRRALQGIDVRHEPPLYFENLR